eukprot:g10209.t1
MAEKQSLGKRIDVAADAFDAALQRGDEPQIESVLAGWAAADRTELLRELLRIEIEFRAERNEPISADTFSRRFPEQVDLIQQLFDAHAQSASPVDETVMQIPQASTIDADRMPGGQSDEIAFGTSANLPAQFGDYEILEEIASGGMGVVYKARQKTLNRVVALKMIKSGEIADGEQILRFQSEAKAAAGLDHPNIVPVYEVGELSGRHFFSMGFVDGAGLDARLREGPLPPREAAQLIKTVAQAVQFAHDRGIVHRDLKPANILLAEQSPSPSTVPAPPNAETAQEHEIDVATETRSAMVAGEDAIPKITDFGLAKNLAADSGMTATGQVMGTPSYMPPEQAAGLVDEVGPPADIYSLGAVLYATLTGRPPFQAANVMETLKQVTEREPVHPAQLNPAVSRDLETICLKCLEKDAHRRYGSAGELADELSRYLDHQPILARPVSRPERVLRWCRRNPARAMVAAMALLIACASPVIAAVQISLRKEADINLAAFKTEKARADDKVVELALAVKRITNQKNRADRNVDRADRLLSEVVTDLADGTGPLSRYPGTQKLRKRWLERARDYYQQFTTDNPDARLTVKLGKAHFNLAQVLAQLSGTNQEAVKAYEKALEIVSGKSSENFKDKDLQLRIGTTLHNVAILYRDLGRKDDAMAANRRALEIFERLADRFPSDDILQDAVAGSYTNLASLLDEDDRARESLAANQQALQILERLEKRFPESEQRLASLAALRTNMANHLSLHGRPDQALDFWQRALSTYERLSARYPTRMEYEHGVQQVWNNIGSFHQRQGDSQKAIQAHQRSLKFCDSLTKKHPDVPRFQNSTAQCLSNLGSSYAQMRQNDAAISSYERATVILDKLIRENPTVLNYQVGLAKVSGNLGDVYVSLAKLAEAEKLYRRAFAIHDRLANEPQHAAVSARNLSRGWNRLGLLYQNLKRLKDARAAFDKSIATMDRLAKRSPDDTDLVVDLAGSRVNLANLILHDEPQAATELLGKAIVALTEVVDRDPRNQSGLTFLRNALTVRAYLRMKIREYAGAVDDWRSALRLDDGRLESYIERQLGLALAHTGQHAEAIALARKSLKSQQTPASGVVMAGTFAVAARSVSRDSRLTADERKQLAARYRSHSMTILRALAKSGLFRYRPFQEGLRTDHNFDPLRKNPEFRKFAASMGVNLPVWASKPKSVGIMTRPCGMNETSETVGGKESFILCRSRDRSQKEEARGRRVEQKIEERLKSMTARCEKQKRDPMKVEREIGRLLVQNTRAARLFNVTPLGLKSPMR